MAGAEEVYTKLTELERTHLNPDVYGDSCELQTQSLRYYDGVAKIMQNITTKMVPMLDKMIDEIITNAGDQKIRYPRQVKTIDVRFDGSVISVFNDGPTIAIEMNKQQPTLYNAQVVFCEFGTSSNYDRTHKTTGGKNGIGAKLTNAFSNQFVVECSCAKSKKYYVQVSKNCMHEINAPIVKAWKDIDPVFHNSFTRISFKPDYTRIGYGDTISDLEKDMISKLIYMRCVYMSIYHGMPITFNGDVINVSMKDYVEAMALADGYNVSINARGKLDVVDSASTTSSSSPGSVAQLFPFKMKDERGAAEKHDYEGFIFMAPDIGHKHMLLVNGVHCHAGGSLLDDIIDKLFNKEIREKIKKTLKWDAWRNAEILKHLMIFVRAPIEDPKYNGQSKAQLKSPSTFPGHKLPDTLINKIRLAITKVIDFTILQKVADSEAKKKKRVLKAKKYVRATKSGGAERAKCSLFIPEGDSAADFVADGITNKKIALGGFSYYGYFNMGGKPMNARKEVKIKTLGDKHVIVKSKKLIEYERWDTLTKIMNLNYGHTYEMTPEGDKQFAQLAYGQIIVAVDQDVDGVGHIFGLILNYFHLFFPMLIRRGFIKRFATPILKAFPRKKGEKTLMFYSDAEYKRWSETNNESAYRVEYFKGLAGHDTAAVIAIFTGFRDHLYTYSLDADSDRLFTVMFDEASAGRKIEFATPIIPYDVPANKMISCSQQLLCETKEYYLECADRHLPHVYDGLRAASRSALAAARKKFKQANTPMKVYQFTGYATSEMHYHHGDASLSETVIKMAQSFPGSKNLPLLYGKGNFGSRRTGVKHKAQPRYISVALNKKLCDAMFPVVDDFLLPYVFDEGVQCQPCYYVPVLPMAILESFNAVSAGWKTDVFARNINEVVANVKSLIMTDALAHPVMKSWFPRTKCNVSEDGAKMLINGDIGINTDSMTVHIKDLPYGVWANDYVENFIDDKNVIEIRNETSAHEVDIEIKLKAGSLGEIQAEQGNKNPELDYITHYFKCFAKLTTHLNMVNDGTVKEYGIDYTAVLMTWFEKRKQLYADRIDRRILQLQYLIDMYEQIVKYADHYAKYGIAGKKADEADAILAAAGYRCLNHVHIEQPLYVPYDELEEYFMKGASYSFLLNLTDAQRLAAPNAKRREKLEDLRRELADLQIKPNERFKGASTWLREIDAVAIVIRDGIASNWTYGDEDVY